MKLLGDISDEHKKLAVELEEMEETLASMSYLTKEYVAKAMVCLAHDWYDLGAEEEGHRLLMKAEQTCPGYFKNNVSKHMKEDEKFNLIMNRILSSIILLLINTVKS